MILKSWAAEKFLEGKLPKWIYRLIGKKVADKIGLEEDMAEDNVVPTNSVDTKSWYKSKSIWTAIFGVVLGAVQPISNALGHPVVIPSWVFELLAGMGLYSLRTATTTVTK